MTRPIAEYMKSFKKYLFEIMIAIYFINMFDEVKDGKTNNPQICLTFVGAFHSTLIVRFHHLLSVFH